MSFRNQTLAELDAMLQNDSPKRISIAFLSLLLLRLLQPTYTYAAVPSEADAPNVILIMADDLGYADLTCYGSKLLRTPAIDKLASEGTRLTSFYSGCTICTPSRMALLTAMYPARLGWRGGVVGYGIDPNNGLAPEAYTIAEHFKKAGYATALCGKWHLGDAPTMLPMNQGFDFAYYITKSNNQTKKLYRNHELLEVEFDNRRLSEQFTDTAINFIETHRSDPFLLYIPYTAPHFPAQPHPEWEGRSKLAEYGDVVEELDDRVGKILDTLEQVGIAKRTIVVFTSDNGPEPGQKKWARSQPYRGLKWSSLEGGNRVPCIVRWPGVVPADRINDQLTAAIDLFPTLAHACGIELATDETKTRIDGVSVWDTWTANDAVHARQELLYWNGQGSPQAIRVGNWKLYFDAVKQVVGSTDGPVLYDLSVDPGERNDCRKFHPERVEEMRHLATKLLTTIESDSIPLGGPEIKPKHRKRALWLD